MLRTTLCSAELRSTEMMTNVFALFMILQVRLVNGLTPEQGRLEVYHSGKWGSVCDDDWDMKDATVTCRMLGYPGASYAATTATFGYLNETIWMDNVGCTGREVSLDLCPHNGFGSHNCQPTEDAGVSCLIPSPELPVRLGGNHTDRSGRIEMFYNGMWGTVCDDTWTVQAASVVCRMLGFERALSAPGHAYFGAGTGRILLDNIKCTGTELSLVECSHDKIGKHNCFHNEDAGVVCDEERISEPIFPTTFFKVEAVNSALGDHVAHSEDFVNEPATCMFLCLLHGKCQSFNYSPNMNKCDLNNSTKSEAPNDFKAKPGYVYYDKVIVHEVEAMTP